MKNISVAIIEDNEGICEAISKLVNDSVGFTCNHIYKNGYDAISELPGLIIDVVLVDINMPGMNGIDCVKKLKELMPGTQFMMETIYEDDDSIFKALRAGATGYILKKTPVDKILEAIRDLYDGGSPMNLEIARRVVSSFSEKNKNDIEDLLTAREREVLKLLSKGLLYKEIASEMKIGFDTIKKHTQNIYRKLHVQNKVEALNKTLQK